MLTTRFTPRYATVIWRVCEAVLPSAEVAVTVIAQRPAVSSRGGSENEPSAATFTVVPGVLPALGDAPGAALAAGAADGAGEAGAALAPGRPEPRSCVVTVTLTAFVVVPSTAIAPFP